MTIKEAEEKVAQIVQTVKWLEVETKKLMKAYRETPASDKKALALLDKRKKEMLGKLACERRINLSLGEEISSCIDDEDFNHED